MNNVNDTKINYLEIPAKDFNSTKLFFSKTFGWKFIDYGSEYMAFENAGIDGGFYKSELSSSGKKGSVLIVFYTKSLATLQKEISKNDGTIIKNVFPFPGGYRFHFTDPNGNEFAAWSEEDH